jgi:hypothetical protein
MAQRFEGSFEVQDNEFELDVRALIVRDDGIAFELEGWDGDGQFVAEGLAPRRGDGSIAPAAIRYRYLSVRGDYRATLQINATHKGKSRLDIQGQWLQFGESWRLRATLKAIPAGPVADSVMR